MIIPDINLLLYAYDADSRFHDRAAAWWQECLSGTELVGLPSVVIFGFVRIGTNARVFDYPMTVAEAAEHVRSWLAQPVTRVLGGRPDHVAHVLDLLHTLGAAGNLVTAAQIAAIAIEEKAVVYTADADFLRFPGLKWINPVGG